MWYEYYGKQHKIKGDAGTVFSVGLLALILVLMLFYDPISSFFQNYIVGLEQGTESHLSATELLTSFCFKIDSAVNDTVYIRNCGKERIFNETIMVFVDGKLRKIDTDVRFVDPHEVMAIRIKNVSEGLHNVRITNGIVSLEIELNIE
jgi:hypothetical protein